MNDKISKLLNQYIYLESLLYKRDVSIWVFTEWFGKRCGDNSTYLANYIADNYKKINLYWICEKNADISMLNPKINVVHKNTVGSKEILTKAAVYIMNQGINEFGDIDLSGGALIVNLWHGVMWKKLGRDAYPEKDIVKAFCHKIIRRIQSVIYECPSEEYKMKFISAYGVNNNNFILAGQPRNSLFFSNKDILEARSVIFNKLAENSNIMNLHTRIITYMPTFRDNSDYIFDFRIAKKIEQLNKILEKHNAIIVQKAHFVSQNKDWKLDCTSSGRIIDGNNLVTQTLLAASDVLITDYSSCFFDFLLLDRPIIHYLYDYDYYANKDRGLYYSYDEVNCGDVIFDEEHLLLSIEEALEHPDKDANLRKERRGRFQTYESEDSCKIITDEIMRRIYDRKNKN